MNLTVDIINQMFANEPTQRGRSFAITKPIPIAFFNQYEDEIRNLGLDKSGYRQWKARYRGPRKDWTRGFTRRDNATHVRMYYK